MFNNWVAFYQKVSLFFNAIIAISFGFHLDLFELVCMLNVFNKLFMEGARPS